MTNSNRVEHASETWLTDATVFEVNRTPAHSNHKCFTHDPQKPYISCEYMHAMGNSVGNLDEYTALERYPHYQGGFIWDFIDQAIYATQPDGSTRLCYGGDFGDRPSDYEFSGNGLVFADRTPAPKAQEVKQLYSNVHIDVTDRSVSIKNDNLFISTGDHHIPRADGQRPWRRPWIRASPVDDGRPLRPLRGQCHRTGR